MCFSLCTSSAQPWGNVNETVQPTPVVVSVYCSLQHYACVTGVSMCSLFIQCIPCVLHAGLSSR